MYSRSWPCKDRSLMYVSSLFLPRWRLYPYAFAAFLRQSISGDGAGVSNIYLLMILSMEAAPKMGEGVADVEKQQPLLLPPVAAAAAAGEKKASSGDGDAACVCEGLPRASPTATRTLALVVLVAGGAFAAQLAAREEYVLLAVFASQLLSFCVFTSLLALCALPEDGGVRGRRGRWAARAAVQVLQWSLAMAVPTSMACWVLQSAPVAVGAALCGLALAVVLACYAELMHALWPAVQGPR